MGRHAAATDTRDGLGAAAVRPLAALIALLLVGSLVAAWRLRGRESPPASVPPAPLPPATPDVLGIADGSSLVFRPAKQLDADLEGMRLAGARWVRFDIWWGAVAPQPGTERWRHLEDVVRAVAAHGLGVVAIPMHPAGWARPRGGGDGSAPADPEQYARFVGEAVQRLAPLGVHVWEIWNEPNTPGAWEPRPDPVAYARLLVAAAREVRAHDRTATVLFGGLAPGGDDRADPADFVARAYASGAKGSFDAMAFHPYGNKALDVTGAEAVRAVMERFGDGRLPVWATEFGVPTSTDDRGVSEAEQARVIESAAAQWRTLPWAGPLLIYMYRDRGGDRTDPDDNFGIVRADGTRKPAFDALRRGAGDPGSPSP